MEEVCVKHAGLVMAKAEGLAYGIAGQIGSGAQWASQARLADCALRATAAVGRVPARKCGAFF